MIEPVHHVPDPLLAASVAGSLAYPFATLVAAHVSVCDECRARLGAHAVLGGLVLEDLDPAPMSAGARSAALDALTGEPFMAPPAWREELYPAPIAAIIGPEGPRWRSLGFGARQAIIWSGAAGTLRLLSIPAGQAVPEHSHGGLEITMVLSGAFADELGVFGRGDMEVADEAVDHTPKATEAGPCVCVAATDAPLRFRAMLPRLLQPIFRI